VSRPRFRSLPYHDQPPFSKLHKYADDTMPNARVDHKTAQNKTQYIKQQEEECHLPGVSQKEAELAGGPPFFAKYPKFSGLYSAVLLRGWNRRCFPTRSWRTACSDAVELWSRSGGAVESDAAEIRVCFLDRLFSGL